MEATNKIYIVAAYIDYEGEEVLFLSHDLEAAIEFYNNFDDSHYSGIYVGTYMLDINLENSRDDSHSSRYEVIDWRRKDGRSKSNPLSN